jgi:type VI protein secretion system component VasF
MNEKRCECGHIWSERPDGCDCLAPFTEETSDGTDDLSPGCHSPPRSTQEAHAELAAAHGTTVELASWADLIALTRDAVEAERKLDAVIAAHVADIQQFRRDIAEAWAELEARTESEGPQ